MAQLVDKYNRLEWLREMGLGVALIKRNNLLNMPDEGFRIMLNRVLSERGRNGRQKGFKVVKESKHEQ